MGTKPVQNGYITSGYGERTLKRKKQFHPGLDIGSKDTKVQIVFAYQCQIVVSGWSDTFGFRVWAKNLEGPYKGLFCVYAHMEKIDSFVKVGKTFNAGDKVGLMGNTGLSEGKHLHFEIRTTTDLTGKSVDPIDITNLYNDDKDKES